MQDKLKRSERIRLEALALAAAHTTSPEAALHTAETFAQFILHGLQVKEPEETLDNAR